MKPSQRFAARVLLLGALCMGAPAWAQKATPVEVGTVLELNGKASLKQGGQSKPLAALDFIADGAVVDLSKEASLTLTLYDKGREFRVQGPSVFKVEKQGLVAVSGNAPVAVVRKTNAAAPDSARHKFSADMNAGAVIMRSVGQQDQSPTTTNGAQK